MKVAVQCESPLLQRSIELFLQNHLSSLKQCDVVIRDKKVLDSYHSLFISSDDDADIKKPFSSSGLHLALDKFYNKIVNIESIKAYDEEVLISSQDPYVALEEKIEALTQEYKNNLLKAVKDFYE